MKRIDYGDPQKNVWEKKMRIGFDVAEEVEEYDQEELQALLVMGGRCGGWISRSWWSY